MISAIRFSLLLGLLFLVEGVWGIFGRSVFGIFATNHLQALMHLAMGLAALWAASTDHPKGFLTVSGIVLTSLGMGWFMAGAGDWIDQVFALNRAAACRDVILGFASLLLAACVPGLGKPDVHWPRARATKT